MKYIFLIFFLVTSSLAQLGTRDISADSVWYKYLLIQSNLGDTVGFKFTADNQGILYIDPVNPPSVFDRRLLFGALNTPTGSVIELRGTMGGGFMNQIQFIDITTGRAASISQSSSEFRILTGPDSPLLPIVFWINNVQRARIDTLGNFAIGNPTAPVDSQFTVKLGADLMRGLRLRALGSGVVRSNSSGSLSSSAMVDTLSKANLFTAVSSIDTLFLYKVDQSGLTARKIYVHRKNGTTASVNVIRVRSGSSVQLRASNFSTTTQTSYLTAMEDLGTLQNTDSLIGDEYFLIITVITGTADALTTQITFDRTKP